MDDVVAVDPLAARISRNTNRFGTVGRYWIYARTQRPSLAAADPQMTDVDSVGASSRSRVQRVVAALGVVGIGLLVLGYSGWVIDEGGEVGLESPFTLAFGVGVGCALGSIYLGLFLTNRD